MGGGHGRVDARADGAHGPRAPDAALRYQHATEDRDRVIAEALTEMTLPAPVVSVEWARKSGHSGTFVARQRRPGSPSRSTWKSYRRLTSPDVQSERRESNPRSQLGKLMYCLCTTLAGATHLWGPMLAGPHLSCQGSRPARTNPVRPPKVAEKLRQKRQRTVSAQSKALHPGTYAKPRGPLGKRPLNVYSHCRSGNPPPAPKSGSEIRRSICSADGAPWGAIGVLGILYCLWHFARQTAQKGCCAWSRRTHGHRRFSLPWRVSYLPDGGSTRRPNGTSHRRSFVYFGHLDFMCV